MNAHYQIGEFAELGGVSAKTLRFYDEIGLLRPASVDPRTGYRRYLPQQLEELATVLALKNLGVSLSKLRELTREEGYRGRASKYPQRTQGDSGAIHPNRGPVFELGPGRARRNRRVSQADRRHRKTPTGSSDRFAESRTGELCRSVDIRTTPLGCGTT